METKLIEPRTRINTFSALFGTSMYKKMPLFIYAENLFYMGMEQMIDSYNGGYFDFIKISNVDENIDIVNVGFLPIISISKNVVITTPFGLSATLNYKAGCLVVWLFVLEQIASSIDDVDVSERLYKTIQDFKYYYSSLKDEKGCRIFSDYDCASMYKLLD